MKIPQVAFPSISDYIINDTGEKLVNCKDEGLICYSWYYRESGIAGSYKDIWVRESVLERLLTAEKSLPDGYHLKLWDGYRPLCVQRRLWNAHRMNIKLKYDKLGITKTPEELDFETSFFVSKPSEDMLHPSLHNTGGAIDLTIVDSQLRDLPMGTEFDAFCNQAWTNYYEIHDAESMDDNIVKENRRLLYSTMINAGFTNLPSEWWHYDYGTKFWAFFKNTNALYKGLGDVALPDQFPLM